MSYINIFLVFLLSLSCVSAYNYENSSFLGSESHNYTSGQLTVNVTDDVYANYTVPKNAQSFELAYVYARNGTWHVCGAINGNVSGGFFNLDCGNWEKSWGHPCLPGAQLEYWGGNEYFCRFTQPDRQNNYTFPIYRNLNNYHVFMYYILKNGTEIRSEELTVSFPDPRVVSYRG